MYPAAPKGGVALKDIAQRVLGEVRGNPELIVMGLCSLTEPLPRSLAFISNSRKRSLASALSASKVDAVLMPLEAQDIDLTGKNVVLVKDRV
jgi:UDP-3-O-[3-hydroxymyristoyl] glucosamine N-acyltransferase